MKERRKFRRFQQWNKAIINSAAAAAGVVLPPCPVDAMAWDLSLGGARIQTEDPFPVGAVVRLHIELVRSREFVGVDAAVRWSRWNEEQKTHEFGVEFQDCTESTLQAIMRNLYHDTESKEKDARPPAQAEKSPL